MPEANAHAPLAIKPKRNMLQAIKQVTTDAWLNILSGIGTLTDKKSFGHVRYQLMTEEETEELYGADDVAAKIVDTLPGDALREWIQVHIGDDEDGRQVATDVLDRLTDLGAQPKLTEAWKWARLYGGSAVLMNVDDSKDLDQPLDISQVRDLVSLTVLSKWELMTTTSDVDLNILSPRYGHPIWYRFAPRRGGTQGTGTKIHHSRLLIFQGVPLPVRLFIQNRYWGDSVLNRARNPIRNYNTSHDAVATILQEFNQGVFKLKGLADMLLNGEDAAVQSRMQTIQLSRSVCRAVVIDSEDDFQNVGAALSGVDAALTKVENRLTVAADMPHDKILGESPSGLGATGDSETRNWYDYVAAQRQLVCKPKVHRLIEILLTARKGPTSGEVPETWSFEFEPLWQMDDKEQADIREIQSRIDQTYIASQVLDPDEVAVSRFGSGKFSTETSLDMTARNASVGAGDTPDDDKPEKTPEPPESAGSLEKAGLAGEPTELPGGSAI